MSFKIGFIGAGNMASAIIGGLVNSIDAKNIFASDINADGLAALQSKFGIQTTQDNKELVSQCDVIVLSVKPQVMQQVLRPIADSAQQKQPLIISIAAGLTSDTLLQWLGGNLAMVRVMPNTPALVGLGASGCFANAQVSAEQKAIVDQVFSAVGTHIWVDNEDDIHTVTAVSGSGPAYFFMFMEAMIAAGMKQGLSEEQAKLLTQQTALGAATMVINTGEQPSELRRKVTSPGGTTAEAIKTFEQQNLIGIVDEAMQACADRSVELAKLLAQ